MSGIAVPDYEAVAADVTAQVLGAGGRGDLLSHITIIPAAASGVGSVTIIDGSTSIVVFAGGDLSSAMPFTVALLMHAKEGPWKVTTGPNVSAIVVGNFQQ